MKKDDRRLAPFGPNPDLALITTPEGQRRLFELTGPEVEALFERPIGAARTREDVEILRAALDRLQNHRRPGARALKQTIAQLAPPQWIRGYSAVAAYFASHFSISADHVEGVVRDYPALFTLRWPLEKEEPDFRSDELDRFRAYFDPDSDSSERPPNDGEEAA